MGSRAEVNDRGREGEEQEREKHISGGGACGLRLRREKIHKCPTAPHSHKEINL